MRAGLAFGRPNSGPLRRDLARAAGSSRTGLNHVALIEAGALMAPPHCHSAEEEVFLVVLDGDGELELWPSRRYGGELRRHELRPGCTVASSSQHDLAHAVRAGSTGMTARLRTARASPTHRVVSQRLGKVSLRGV